jgi:hypothetical protein
VRKHDTDNLEWLNIKFMVFDAPKVKGNFKTRLAYIEKELAKKPCDQI